MRGRFFPPFPVFCSKLKRSRFPPEISLRWIVYLLNRTAFGGWSQGSHRKCLVLHWNLLGDAHCNIFKEGAIHLLTSAISSCWNPSFCYWLRSTSLEVSVSGRSRGEEKGISHPIWEYFYRSCVCQQIVAAQWKHRRSLCLWWLCCWPMSPTLLWINRTGYLEASIYF